MESQWYLLEVSKICCLFGGLLKDVLWCDEAMQQKPPETMGYMDDRVVPFLFIHGEYDLCGLCSDRRVVAVPPVE